MTDLRVDPATIEKQLAELWSAQEREDDQEAVTKAALWNVVAHTWTADEQAHATEVLGRASAAVPQRTIVVRADPAGNPSIGSWISANCHLVGAGRKICSEEVTIQATGENVHHVPPLVSALLLPDMPVAVWWVGDLPHDHEYAEPLLEPADRLIFDSARLDSYADLDLVCSIATQTTTAPADLNWERLEEWRVAAAALFEPPRMRARLKSIRNVRIVSGGDASFGTSAQALLFVGWLRTRIDREIPFELASEGKEAGIVAVDFHFEDGTTASLRENREHGVVVSSSGAGPGDCMARALGRDEDDLIVRLLKRPEADRIYLEALAVTRQLGR